MIINKTGDLLKSDCDIIVHQVNVNGIMGGGIARQIAEQNPILLQDYEYHCNAFCNKYCNSFVPYYFVCFSIKNDFKS